MGDNARG
jgi:hypothetical protein